MHWLQQNGFHCCPRLSPLLALTVLSPKCPFTVGFSTIESLDSEVKVMDVLKEFEIPLYDEQITEATEIQDYYRLDKE